MVFTTEQKAMSEAALGKPGVYRVSWYGRWSQKPVHHAEIGPSSCVRAMRDQPTTLGFETLEKAVSAGHHPCKRCFPSTTAIKALEDSQSSNQGNLVVETGPAAQSGSSGTEPTEGGR